MATLLAMSVSAAAVRRLLSLSVLVLLALAMTASLAIAQTDDGDIQESSGEPNRRVEILPLRDGFIDPPVTAQIMDVITEAEESGSELVVLQYSSAGGVSVDVDEVLERFDDTHVPIAVLVGPAGAGAEAAGAGGLLWLAADIRAVSIDATVGPIDPIDLAGPDRDQATQLAGSLLADADSALPQTLLDEVVGSEALVEAGAVDFEVTGLEPLLVELDGVQVGDTTLQIRADEVEVRMHSLGLVRRLLHAATTAPFIYLLLVIGLGMLLFEVFQPGFGVAGMAGILTLGISGFGLFVMPVTWWAVALVVLGLILYALDTAIAGFGFVTAAATASFVAGSVWFYDSDALALSWWLIAATALTALIFFVFVMTTILRAQAGPEGVSVDDLVGRPGIVRSVLNPEGHVYIDGALWRARWTGDTRRAKVGTPVKVHDVDGPVVLVEPFEPDQPQQPDQGPVGTVEKGASED